MSEKAKEWERQRDGDGKLEPNLWLSRFTAYRLKGPVRSLLACVNAERVEKGQKRSSYIPGSWRRASAKWRWRERAEAWDEHCRLEDEVRWAEHRRELREREWETAKKLLEKAEQMLRFPVQEVVVEEGKTVIKPAGWRFRDVAAILDTASKLARLASEMETERKKIGVTLDDVLAGLPGEFGEAVRRALTESLSR